MASYQQFQDALAAANNGASELRLESSGGLRERTLPERFSPFRDRPAENVAVCQDLKTMMVFTFGPEAANAGCAAAGLNHLEALRAPLTRNAAQQAIQAAMDRKIELKNAEHLQSYQQRDADAQAWQPQVRISTLNDPALRCLHSDQGLPGNEIRIHSWVAKNNRDDPNPLLELDNLVHLEMAAIQQRRQQDAAAGLPVNDPGLRLTVIEARLNLMERMAAEASDPAALRAGGVAANVFTAPDMFFSGMDGTNPDGTAGYGGALTEQEMRKVTEELTAMSGRYPNLLMMPGTMVWNKPVAVTPQPDGHPLPADMVFNTAPVVANGRLEHMVYKQSDGGDADWAAIGKNGDDPKAYTAPHPANNCGARLQVFPEDQNAAQHLGAAALASHAAVAAQMQQDHAPNSPQRQWENALRGGAVQSSNYNHIFSINGQVATLEICRDRGARKALNEFEQANPVAGDPVHTARNRQNADGTPNPGTDLCVLLSAGGGMAPNNQPLRAGGIAVHNDVSVGMERTARLVALNDPAPGMINMPTLQRTYAGGILPAGSPNIVNVPAFAPPLPAPLAPAPPPPVIAPPPHVVGGLGAPLERSASVREMAFPSGWGNQPSHGRGRSASVS